MSDPIELATPEPRPGDPSIRAGESMMSVLRRTNGANPLDIGLTRELTSRLIGDLPLAIGGHLLVMLVMTAVMWSVAPHGALLAWSAAIALPCLVRAGVWRRVNQSQTPEPHLTTLRVASTVVALVWGLGGAWLCPSLAPQDVALLLLIMSGLVAGGTGTLTADLTSFRLFAISLLLPFALVLLGLGQDRFHLAAVVLITLFGAFTVRFHTRTYYGLVERLRDSIALTLTHKERERGHLFLDALFASVPSAIAVVDEAGICLGINPAFERLFGFTGDEVIGRPLVEYIVPQTRHEESRRMQSKVHRGESVFSETERIRKDGSLVRVQISVEKVGGDDERRLLLVYTDVTEIRRTEALVLAAQERLELVVASSTAILYAIRIVDGQFEPSWVSNNLTRITGYEVGESLSQHWWESHVHPEDKARVLASLPLLLADGHLTQEYRFEFRDGYRWLRDESRLHRDIEGVPQELFGAWLDITDLKLAEVSLREGRDMAERSARARSEFLANMSHEIRTPMNAVLGLTELVLDTDLTGEQRRSLRLVQSAGETLLTLLNDILDLSKIEAEHLTLEAIPFDPRYLLESTVGLLAVRASDKPVELVADIRSDVPNQVMGDPTRLRQVLSNLVGNALKFTEQGEVVLSCQTEIGAKGESRLRFAVRDTGIGIAPTKLATIFEKFTQADASMTRKYGGTGLGLAISQRLVDLMGGALAVTSILGEGSEFTFSIAAPVETKGANPPLTASLSGQRILVVDDNETNRRIVREVLTSAGATVDEASSAAAGLAVLRAAVKQKRPCGLAIIDSQMPDRDGFSLAADIRADKKLAAKVRLLMLTSAGQRGDTQKCREVGIEAYLMKPLSRSDLLDATAVVLGTAGSAPAGGLITRHTIAESRPRLRILLAEDNAVNQEVAATMLRKRGHLVMVVNNGVEAVTAVETKGPFDLVLMDIQMPELDGFGATREIRRLPAGRDLPILALTAHALSGERERCLAQGMNGYVPKPFRPQELFSAVESIPVAAHPPEPRAATAVASVTVPPPAATEVPAVDLVEFRRSMKDAGIEDSADRILDLFLESGVERLAALTTAAGARDGAGMARAAHAFRSPAGAIGAIKLAEGLMEMELAGKSGAIDQACAVFNKVEPEARRVMAYLSAHRGREVSNA